MNPSQTITLRPIDCADAPALLAFVNDGLGAVSRRLRFHGSISGCSDGLLRQLAGVDGRCHVAWAAWVHEGDRRTLVGEARFCIEADGATAELAIAVADAWQGRGIADRLMRALVESARKAGVRWLYGVVLDNNARMAAFMCRHGFDACVHAGAEGVVRFERNVAAAPRVKRQQVREHRLLQWALERLFGIAVPATL